MTHWGMYWFTRLDSLKESFYSRGGWGSFGFAIFTTTIFLIFLINSNGFRCTHKEFIENLKSITIKKYILFFTPMTICIFLEIMCGVLYPLIPTTKEAAAIYLIPKIANNEKLNNIAESSLNILELKAKEYLDDLAKTEKAGENN